MSAGWVSESKVVGTDLSGLGSRMARVQDEDADNIGFTGKRFAAASFFGRVSLDVFAAADDGVMRTFSVGNLGAAGPEFLEVSTTVALGPGGAVQVLQREGVEAQLVATSGAWTPGQVTRFTIEVVDAASRSGDLNSTLRVFQNGGLIFQGHDLLQLGASSRGTDDMNSGFDSLAIRTFDDSLSDDDDDSEPSFSFDNVIVESQTIPAPSAAGLGLAGMAGVVLRRRRRGLA